MSCTPSLEIAVRAAGVDGGVVRLTAQVGDVSEPWRALGQSCFPYCGPFREVLYEFAEHPESIQNPGFTAERTKQDRCASQGVSNRLG